MEFLRPASGAQRSLPVGGLIEKFVESKRLHGMSGRYLKDLQDRLDRFKADFGK